MPNKGWTGLDLSFGKERKSEETQTQLRTSGETVDELVDMMLAQVTQTSS